MLSKISVQIYTATSRKENANHEEYPCQDYIISLWIFSNLTSKILDRKDTLSSEAYWLRTTDSILFLNFFLLLFTSTCTPLFYITVSFLYSYFNVHVLMSYLPHLTGNSCGKSIIVYTFYMCLPPHHGVPHRTIVLSLILECLPLFLLVWEYIYKNIVL